FKLRIILFVVIIARRRQFFLKPVSFGVIRLELFGDFRREQIRDDFFPIIGCWRLGRHETN
ncbi:MAG TPA: hypothetical protein VHM22_21400, partial [Bradyrhizobium sp.]|nr:hypothetical protein [Bradyrhizobium sp.]